MKRCRHTIKILDVDAINNAIVPMISLPASGFACQMIS